MTSDTHHWSGVIPDPEKYYGFVYLITNLETGMKYIGRKFYQRYRRGKPIGKSQWEYYTGSSKYLNEDIKKLGVECFSFEMLAQYSSRGMVMYAEANLQHKYDVLLERDDKGNRMWYNRSIPAIKFIPKKEVNPNEL